MEEYAGGDEFLEELRRDRKFVYVAVERPSPPDPGPPVEHVVKSEELRAALRGRGIERLYRFQAEAVRLLGSGRNVLIAAGTGTGKTEAFLIPILERVLEEPYRPEVRALLVYPTKALARDQLSRVNSLVSSVFGVRALVFDGDTSEREREVIYQMPPQILVTNPDMLHYGIMRSPRFRDLISTAEFVVLDDVHAYSGVLGAHVHYVLRRLRRLLRSEPVLAGTSATIGNPGEFASALFGVDVEVVDAGSGRRGLIYHALVKPVARSRLAEVASLVAACVRRGLKTIAFADSHRAVELIRRVCARLGVEVLVHRAGLLPAERRRVEEALQSGRVLAVAATPTLELGIDIGDLDCVILANVPPSYGKYVQRTGRCGRRGGTAYVFTVLGNDPISQYYETSPSDFFGKGVEPLFVEPGNEEVAKMHLLAAAFDKPLKQSELSQHEAALAEALAAEGLLRYVKSRDWYRPTQAAAKYLSSRPGLRGMGEIVRIHDRAGRLLGYREMPMALKELFPGAIYLHGGGTYVSLELKGGRAVVARLPDDYPFLTSSLYYSEPVTFEREASREVWGFKVEYGRLRVREIVYGYVVKEAESGATVREALLSEEYSYEFPTRGILLRLPPNPEWSLTGNAEAFHAIEHVTISAGQTVVGASMTDMGGISYPTGHIFIYDSYPGGSGCSKLLFHRLEEALSRALRIISSCTCEDGCPKCIYSPYCGNNNKILSRRKALHLLTLLAGGKAPAPPPLEVAGQPIA
ncbi:MAG: DEAD/DEAH box helicase [Thermofilaceae archaeon]